MQRVTKFLCQVHCLCSLVSSQISETFFSLLKAVILQAKIISDLLPDSHTPEALCFGEQWSVE